MFILEIHTDSKNGKNSSTQSLYRFGCCQQWSHNKPQNAVFGFFNVWLGLFPPTFKIQSDKISKKKKKKKSIIIIVVVRHSGGSVVVWDILDLTWVHETRIYSE